MRFQRTQKTLTFALALVGAIPLIASTEIGMVFSGAFLVLWTAGWFIDIRLMRSPAYRQVVTVAVVVLMGVQLLRMATGVPMAMVGMEFIAAIMGIKLISRGYAGDYYQIVILAFLHIIAATVAIDDLLYGVCFVLFVGLSSPVLALSYLRQEMENRFSPNTDEGGDEILERLFNSKRIISSGFVFATALLSIPILFMTAILFVVFPRLGLGLLGRLPSTQAEVGFGDTVTLGDLDIVRMEDTVLLRLIPTDTNASLGETLDLKFRGAVFDTFADNTWTKTPAKGWRRLAVTQQRYLLDRGAVWQTAESFKVLLEPMMPKLLFLPEGTGIVHTDLVATAGRPFPRMLETNEFGEVRYRDDSEVGIRYRVDLTSSAPVGAPPSATLSYMQLPDKSDRIVRLARELAPDTSKRRIVHQLLTALKTRYRYSLRLSEDQRNLDEETPIERFLFSRKTGTCEHFSTSLTLLLRARGIPARLVTGFSGADWNPIGQFYSVRKHSAHSWTEAFLDGRWVTLDATPGTTEAVTGPTPSMLSMVVDTLRMRWHRHVIGYDLATQGEIAIAVWRYWRRSRASMSATPFPRFGRIVPIALLMVAILGFAAYRLRKWSLGRSGGNRSTPVTRATQKEASRLFSLMERQLEKLGFPRPGHLTPLEHVRTMKGVAPALAESTREIIQRYNEVRFGTLSFRPGESRSLAGKIRALSRDPVRSAPSENTPMPKNSPFP